MKDIIRKLKERKFITKVDVSEEDYKDDITQTGDPDEIIKYVESKYEPERTEYPITKESNPILMKLIAHWLAASEDFMTWDEAEKITEKNFLFRKQGGYEDPGAFPSAAQSVLNGFEYFKKAINEYNMEPYSFDEFQYFTKITVMPSVAGAHFTSITLPPTITEIDSLYDNNNLKLITILSKTAPTIKSETFREDVTIRVPKDATGYDVAPWTNYTIERLEE